MNTERGKNSFPSGIKVIIKYVWVQDKKFNIKISVL